MLSLLLSVPDVKTKTSLCGKKTCDFKFLGLVFVVNYADNTTSTNVVRNVRVS